eukprot:403360566
MLQKLQVTALIVSSLSLVTASQLNIQDDNTKNVPLIISLEQCMHRFSQYDFEYDCFMKVSSVGIGYLLTCFAVITKFPQIIKIYQDKSTEGILEIFFYIDLFNLINVVAWFKHYNYPFNTYGDSISIMAQQIILIIQMWIYTGSIPLLKKLAIALLFIVQITIMLVYDQEMPDYIFDFAKSSILFFLLISRIPQIWNNFKNKSSGKLSMATLYMIVSGQTLKLFSIYQQLNDQFAIIRVKRKQNDFD